MNHIDQLELILEEITSYTIIQSKINAASEGVWIQPSNIYNTFTFEETEFFDIVVLESTLTLLQTKKKALLRCQTLLDFDWNSYDARGYIGVADGTQFAVNDDLTGGTSLATGTVYEIDGNTLKLKNVTGTWQSGEVISDGATHTSTTTSVLIPYGFPFYLNTTLVRYDYPVDVNASVGGTYACWIRIEARWAI